MATLTIELPDELIEQVHERGISQQRLNNMVIHLVQEFLREWDETSSNNETSPDSTDEFIWSDAEAFARRMIANNRALFEELSQL